jgi:CheY-like chemotaxis protein/HPt (histidine-containing phosphotransfer) domain-containing protein
VKYTKKGFVSFNVSGRVINERTVNLTIEVVDSGRGIRREDMKRLFGEFARFDLAENKGIEGTGLGLAITRNLVKAMGGEISVNSKYGEGSTFTVILPQKFRKRESLASVENPEKASILIYERRKIYSDSIIYAADNLGVCNTHVSTETEFHEEMSKRDYSFIFAEAALYEYVEKMCTEFVSAARIVLLKEFGESTDEKNVSILTMPVFSVSVANVINGVPNNFSYNIDNYPLMMFTAPAASVLIVDDIETNLKVAEGLLQPYNMQITTCLSGADAINTIKSEYFDLVFMDHMMPEMDGIETTARIRSLGIYDPKYLKMPIIALTANAVFGTKEMFLENGFNDFLSKPINTVKLEAILTKWIPKEKQFISEEENGKIFVEKKQEMNYDIKISGVDINKGIAMTGGKVEYYLRTLSVFHQDGLDKIKEIKTCLEIGDLPLYVTHVHALKSASASIGASGLSEIARSLEIAGKSGNISFIESNNDRFLYELEILLNNIKHAMPIDVTTEGDESAESMNVESKKDDLQSLKEALNEMDTIAADKIINDLLSASHEATIKETLKQIEKHILMCDYEDAISKINVLLDGINRESSE